MAIKFIILTCSLAFCCAAKLVKDGDDHLTRETPSGSWFGFELLITQLEIIEKKLTKLDTLEQKLTKLNNVEEKLTKFDYLAQKIARLEISEKVIDILNQKLTKLDIVEQKLFKLEKIIEKQAKNVFQTCSEEPSKISGKYRLQPDSHDQSFVGYCEQEKYGGGWLVIQHHFDGSVNFYRNWADYKNGFGKIDGEFWIGLERLHKLTQNNPMNLMVEIEDYDGNYGYASYDKFEIGNEAEKYVLKQLSGYSGSVPDSMSDNQGCMFTTRDSDNDENESGNCAQLEKGAWWYDDCGNTNPNGPFDSKKIRKKIYWKGHREGVKLKYFRMMIK